MTVVPGTQVGFKGHSIVSAPKREAGELTVWGTPKEGQMVRTRVQRGVS